MKIGDYGIGDVELVTGQDKKVHPPLKRVERGISTDTGGILHQPNGGGSNTDYPSPLFFGKRNLIGNLFADVAVFEVQFMQAEVFTLYRAKSIQPDMQGGKKAFNSVFTQGIDKIGVKCKPAVVGGAAGFIGIGR